MIKQLIAILFFVLVFLPVSCQDNKKNNTKNMNSQKYEWSETINCPPGYPIDVYKGGLESENGEFTSLYLGTHSGNEGWGSTGRSMSNGFKSIPNHLHVIWVSYAEKLFYEVDTPIDADKMYQLFREGFYVPSTGDDPRPKKENYDKITVGFAPGGVVVVWLSGMGRQIEIGRYEGKKITIPQQEVDALSPGPQKNMFDPEYQRKIMYEFDIVPQEVVKANEGKPIPYGIWDEYRKIYQWDLQFELPNNGKTDEIDLYMFNAEKEYLFGSLQLEKFKTVPQYFRWDFKKERALPQRVYFSWYEEKEVFEGNIYFDFEELSKAFSVIGLSNVQMKIRVNQPRTSASVRLLYGDSEVWIKNTRIVIN